MGPELVVCEAEVPEARVGHEAALLPHRQPVLIQVQHLTW